MQRDGSASGTGDVVEGGEGEWRSGGMVSSRCFVCCCLAAGYGSIGARLTHFTGHLAD